MGCAEMDGMTGRFSLPENKILPAFLQRSSVRRGHCHPVSWGDKSMALTASIGVAVGSGSEDFEAVMTRADDALYRAKRGGRNQVAA